MFDIRANRAALEAATPEAIAALVAIMRKPGRNAGTQLGAIKAILDRVGLQAVQDVTVAAPGGGPVTLVIMPVPSPEAPLA